MTEQIARERFVGEHELRQLEISGLQKMIGSAFSNEDLSASEEQRITALCNIFGIAANDLGEPGLRLAKVQILRRLDEGKLPENIQIDGSPINWERNETPVWLYNNVIYYRLRNRTHYVGGSSGLSIRVMKGVYYRVGAFRGEPVKTQYLAEEGRGILALTNRNVYFWSPQSAFKVPLKKIIAVQPYSDGIQITRDAASAVPQIFKLDDPLFACDAIARLSRADI